MFLDEKLQSAVIQTRLGRISRFDSDALFYQDCPAEQFSGFINAMVSK